MTNKQGNNKKYQTCKSRKNLCFSFFFFWFIYFFVFTFTFFYLFFFYISPLFLGWMRLQVSRGRRVAWQKVEASINIYKFIYLIFYPFCPYMKFPPNLKNGRLYTSIWCGCNRLFFYNMTVRCRVRIRSE